MVLSRLAHVVFVEAICGGVSFFSFLLIVIFRVYLKIIRQIDFRLSFLGLVFNHLLVLILDSLLDFLGLKHR